MRYYAIEIVDETDTVVKDNSGKPLQFTSLIKGNYFNSYRGQATNQGALNIEMDIALSVYSEPLQNSFIRVWGIPLNLLSQANQFSYNQEIPDKRFYAKISGGMWKGLPLANPMQSGILTTGLIVQSFGNWQGTNQSLDLYLSASQTGYGEEKNFTFTWLKGMKLKDAIEDTLLVVYEATEYKIEISEDLVLTQNVTHAVDSLSAFADYLNVLSKSIILDNNYSGVEIAIYPSSTLTGLFYITDNFTYNPTPKKINFVDLVGQPTWKKISTISFNVILRADLRVNDYITLPQQLSNYALITSPAGYASTPIAPQGLRHNSIFNNTFRIKSLRHVGNFRDGNGNSWVTTIEAFRIIEGT